MRAISVYEVTCECGHHIETELCEVTCPKCRRVLVLEWGGKPKERKGERSGT